MLNYLQVACRTNVKRTHDFGDDIDGCLKCVRIARGVDPYIADNTIPEEAT